MKLKQLFENMILQESMNYEEMFNRMFSLFQELQLSSETMEEDEYLVDLVNFLRRTAKSEILMIKNVLNRSDFIVWMVRLTLITSYMREQGAYTDRRGLLSNVSPRRQQFVIDTLNDDIFKVASKFANPQYAINYLSVEPAVAVLSSLEHFLSLPIPAIQEFRFTNQVPSEVLDYFIELEHEWKKGREGLIPMGKEEIEKVIDFGDGFAWYNLDRAYCPDEGDAMGHCGNSPAAGDPNQTIYSLRETVEHAGEKFYHPHATFIFHKNLGVFGEMKGRGNEKPSPKYHNYILDLVMQPWVNGLVGGGYLADNNFSIKDVAGWKQYVQKKPKLLPLDEYIETFGVDNYIDNLFYLTFHTAENENQQEFASNQLIKVPLFSSKYDAEVSMILTDELKLSDHYVEVEGDSIYRGVAPFNFLKKLGVIPSDFSYPHDTITPAERNELIDMIDMEFKNMVREGLESFARNSEYFVRNIWINYDGRVSYDYGSDAIYGTLEIPSRNLDSIEINIDNRTGKQTITLSISKQDIIQRILDHEDSFRGHHDFEINLYMDAGRLDDDIIEWSASIHTLSELFRVSHIAPNATSRMTYFVLNMFTDQNKYDWDTKR